MQNPWEGQKAFHYTYPWYVYRRLGYQGQKRLVLPDVTEDDALKILSGAQVEAKMRRELLQKLKAHFETDLKKELKADLAANTTETGVGDGRVLNSWWKPPTIMVTRGGASDNAKAIVTKFVDNFIDKRLSFVEAKFASSRPQIHDSFYAFAIANSTLMGKQFMPKSNALGRSFAEHFARLPEYEAFVFSQKNVKIPDGESPLAGAKVYQKVYRLKSALQDKDPRGQFYMCVLEDTYLDTKVKKECKGDKVAPLAKAAVQVKRQVGNAPAKPVIKHEPLATSSKEGVPANASEVPGDSKPASCPKAPEKQSAAVKREGLADSSIDAAPATPKAEFGEEAPATPKAAWKRLCEPSDTDDEPLAKRVQPAQTPSPDEDSLEDLAFKKFESHQDLAFSQLQFQEASLQEAVAEDGERHEVDTQEMHRVTGSLPVIAKESPGL